MGCVRFVLAQSLKNLSSRVSMVAHAPAMMHIFGRSLRKTRSESEGFFHGCAPDRTVALRKPCNRTGRSRWKRAPVSGSVRSDSRSGPVRVPGIFCPRFHQVTFFGSKAPAIHSLAPRLYDELRRDAERYTCGAYLESPRLVLRRPPPPLSNRLICVT